MLDPWPLGRALTLIQNMEQPLPIPESPSEASPPTGMSLGARLMNVFATPAEVFDSVKTAPDSAANWVVPALILILVSWVGSALIFSQDSIKHQISDITEQAIQKQIEKSHMSEQQAEQARTMGEKWAGISSRIGAAVIPVFAGFCTPFIWGLFIWLVGDKVLKGGFSYMKAVEVVGLGNMVVVLDAIIKTLLIVGLGNLYASPSLVLLIKNFDPQNTGHSLLALVNLMTFWVLAVRAVGLARLSGASFGKAAAWVFGIWAAYTGFFIGLGLLLKMVFQRIGG
jgi:hypothetical protein